ncbi:hypothetical protein NEF87_000210 [Candidatus Lokiarchaeum ossiferum]|uniref:DUF6602 domain-containing protein n=1 Tax=Candidatus Lokiarchaeum ossiferum TaxID=2951803 RepID=A0ABY6HKK7_9ARCH|nr:hypothetical protein NEF87_000210 [Candidatus Lokiarchaeum sp. B-35]
MTEFGPQGWKQFIQNREKILNTIDTERKAHENQQVQTDYGFLAEQKLNEWLNEFLPKRFAATKGYVVSDNYKFWNEENLEEYDIIIYDQFLSPVLWSSSRGDDPKRIIPFKYVHAVYEVKGKFNSTKTKEAIEKLSKLNMYINSNNNQLEIDYPTTPIKTHFHAGMIFIDVPDDTPHPAAALYHLVPDQYLNYIKVGLIMRSHQRDVRDSALIYYNYKTHSDEIVWRDEKIYDNGVHESKTKYYSTVNGVDLHCYAGIQWRRDMFSTFIFSLLDILNFSASTHCNRWLLNPSNLYGVGFNRTE